MDVYITFQMIQGVQLKIPMVEKRFLDLYTLQKVGFLIADFF